MKLTAEAFNKKHPVGTRVKYFPYHGSDYYKETKTCSAAWGTSIDDAVVRIHGNAGAVNLGRLEAIMNPIPEEHLLKLKQHGAVWRFLKKSKGYRAALCYVDEKREEHDVVETEDFCLASVKERELKAQVKFENSIDDLLEDQKRYIESVWGGQLTSLRLFISLFVSGEPGTSPWSNDLTTIPFGDDLSTVKPEVLWQSQPK